MYSLIIKWLKENFLHINPIEIKIKQSPIRLVKAVIFAALNALEELK